MAVADLRHCYDRIDHAPLLRRIAALPLEAQYHVVQARLISTGPARGWSVALALGAELQAERLRREPLLVVPRPLQVDLSKQQAAAERL